MSLSSIVGEIDFSTAAFLSVSVVSAGAVALGAIAKFTGRQRSGQEFELEKLKLANADAADARKEKRHLEVELGKVASNREVEIRRIDGGMITASKTGNGEYDAG
jgi:hypothetical protein